MTICDANYEFTFVDIGDTVRNDDGGVFGINKLEFFANQLLQKKKL